MKVFILGATGYIGGSVADALVKKGYRVSGLARSEEKAKFLENQGVKAVLGDLSDTEVLRKALAEADIVINSTSSDDFEIVQTIVNELKGSGKTFIQTSGSAVVSDGASGGANDKIYDECDRPESHPLIRERVALDKFVTDSAEENIRSIVICPTMVYGIGTGFNKHSIQIPFLIKTAKEKGAANYIGRGANRWSNVHIEDLVELYLLAIEKAEAGDFLFVENGEAELKAISDEIGRLLDIPSESFTQMEANEIFGEFGAVLGFGSNSRVKADKARKNLGWNPKFDDIISSIKEDI